MCDRRPTTDTSTFYFLRKYVEGIVFVTIVTETEARKQPNLFCPLEIGHHTMKEQMRSVRLLILAIALAFSNANAFLLGRPCGKASVAVVLPNEGVSWRGKSSRWNRGGVPVLGQSRRDGESLTITESSIETTNSPIESRTKPVDLTSSSSREEAASQTLATPSSDGSTIPGLGLLVLCSVPLVWGTYVPIVRLLYEIDPPIPGFLFSACYFFISSVTTLGLSKALDSKQTTSKSATDQAASMATMESKPDQTRTEILAGLELGSWLFLGNTLQLLGLKTVPSDRAGFLVQCKCSQNRKHILSLWYHPDIF